MKPYKESKNGNIIRRTFSHDVSENELVWHRDREDRIVLPLNENDWMVQFDNQLPTKLMVGEEYFIPKNVYHRVIKGNGDLMVEIIETNFNDDAYEIYEVIEEGKKKKKKKKKDACYHKVRARYDVWPSAYASGALVKCRKVGAANWGNSSNESVNEVITSQEPKAEVDTFLTRSLNTLSRFIYGKDVIDFMNKLKNIATFDNFTLKLSKGGDGANQFIIEILDGNNKVGKFVAFIYKDKETGNQNLQIQKVEIYPEYKGKGIMRKFYQEFNEWLKDNLNNFDKFTSDFIFLYNKETGKYDGFNMWEDLVKKGLAKRLGPDSDYIPPTTPPKNGMWSINSGYALNEVIEEKWSSDYKKSIDCNNPKGFSQKAHCDARKKRQRGEETKSKPINENVSEISRIVNQYMKDTEYDIQNSLGNCSFFTRDMINWANKNSIKADYVYMPMSEEYRKENNISDSEWEDHIAPMINGVIIDFAYTPQGVSKNVRTKNTIPPRVFNYSDNLFKPNGIYGKFGYTKPEINTEYGNSKNINSFDVVEPNKKKEKLDLLREIGADDAYNSFYKTMFNKDNPELDRKIYDTILKLDPTFKEGKIGQYSKWLFRSDNLKKILNTKDEDLYKIYDDLNFFNNAKIKNVLPSDKRDINKFNIETLLDFVFSFSKDGEELMSNKDKERELKKDTKRHDLTNWTIIIPQTEEASCYYGKGTKWCTAADKYNNAFDSHNRQGPLYILISKDTPSEKYQFHFETSQFMDVKDNDIDLGEFMEDNEDVYEFFSKIKGEELDYKITLSCVENYRTECFENFYSRNFTDEQKEKLVNAAFNADNNSDDYYMFTQVLNYVNYDGLERDFRDNFIWALEHTFSYNKYDEENYNAIMFIDYLGGFNEENISDILKCVDFNEIDEINSLFEIAEHYDALKLLRNYLEDEDIDINFEFITFLDNIKKKFKYNEYENSYESSLVKIRVKGYDVQDGTLNIELTPKDENGKLITDKTERGNIDYKSMTTYLTSPSLFAEAKKTDFSKEKSKGLHGWFERQGGKGKSKGWVDCNTCRKDPETGRKKCKTCGRKDGEERAKYPACRPTPSACGTRGKGKKWGKKTSNENLNVSENFSIFDKNYLKMKLNETFNYEEPLVLPAEPVTKPKESPMVQPSRRNKPFLPERKSQPDPKAITENKNVKEISINIPNEQILKRVMSTPTLNRLVRTELKVGQNIERVNHKQYSDIVRLYPMLGIEINEL